MRRRELLAHLAVSTTAAAAPRLAAAADHLAATRPADALASVLQRCLLVGVPAAPGPVAPDRLRQALSMAMGDFHACRYTELARRLPGLLSAAHTVAVRDTPAASAVLTQTYILISRMAVKLNLNDLGLIAADRARTIAPGAADPVLAGEAARDMAVLVRRSGLSDRAASIALDAADQLSGGGLAVRAQRGLLVMSAAYTAARSGDSRMMRTLTREAAYLASTLGDRVLLPAHGGGFGVPVVQLHQISGLAAAGEPGAALNVADSIRPSQLPTTERRARYWTDVAAAASQCGQHDRAAQALLAAEKEAPQEVYSRPAVLDLTRSLVRAGHGPRDLRVMAARMGFSR
ncbi:hypothetical protein [Actinocorallia sp. A-T 12471]|uniref:hypothetical protein n=1 Tax=Actinocorallia sp. A-T 12471 TaxID=3089813 RepID=UPI0029D0C031|nr:hypothetical protein [Actinocorallia sp. A-T 12471]MDX6740191.1 hypothetical protein [Actinocorallia sp. A-T 12471]